MEMINAIGRRKTSVARVYLTEGTGKIIINKVELEKYFPSAILQYVVKQPLQLLNVEGKYDIKANLDGGGYTGQSQALRLAIARALVKSMPTTRRLSRTKASSHAIHAPLSVKSRDARRHAAASSSASVNVVLCRMCRLLPPWQCVAA